MPVKRFINDYWFLSNFYPIDFKSDGLWYPSVEHFYQSHKIADADFANQVREAKSPSEAKSLARVLPIRQDWEDVKLTVMEIGLRLKFGHPYLAGKLKETGGEDLVEGNTWGDTFWGVDLQTGEGENHLGRLLMQIRSEM